MIRVSKDGIMISGNGIEITADLAEIIRAVYKAFNEDGDEEFARASIVMAGKLAFCETDADYEAVRKEIVDGNII